MENGPEDTLYKPVDTVASEASYASDALATPLASVQQRLIKSSISKASTPSDHTLYMKKNGPEDIQYQSKNDVVSAKIICHINFKGNDFNSAEIICTLNGPTCDRSTYDQSADTPLSIDTLPPPLYNLIESDQTRPFIHVKLNVDRVRRNFLIFSIFKWPKKIKINSIYSMFDQLCFMFRFHHIFYLRRSSNDRTNNFIYFQSDNFINMFSYFWPFYPL